MTSPSGDYQAVALHRAARQALRRMAGLAQAETGKRVTLSDALVACTAVASAHLDDYRREVQPFAK